jgi:hypothetical protein
VYHPIGGNRIVDLIARRFRGVLIALVVLGLSASAVFAGHVALQAAASAPTTAEQGDQDEQADENDNEAPDADEDDDADEQGDEDGDGDTADNHGALVSRAAQMDEPEGFKNHGEFVSCVAHMKDVTDPAAFDLAALTPETCGIVLSEDEAALQSPDERDETTETETGNHGVLVSRAAQMTEPAGFANHGAFVSCVAHMKDVTDPAAFDFTTVTVASCDEAAALRAADKAAAKADKVHGKSGQHGKGRNRN